LAALIAAELRDAGWADGALPLIVESFEGTILTELREHGIRGTYIFLCEASGRPFDLVAAHGRNAPTYRALLEPAGLDDLAARVDGISLDKRLILAPDRRGRVTGPAPVVADAH